MFASPIRYSYYERLQVKKIICEWLARLVLMKRPINDRSMLVTSRYDGANIANGVGNAMNARCGLRNTIVSTSSSRCSPYTVSVEATKSRFKKHGCRDYHRRQMWSGVASSTLQLAASPIVNSPASTAESNAADTDRLQLPTADAALGAILHELRLLTGKLRDDEVRLAICSEWKFAAMVVDRCCLVLFFVFTAVSTFSILFVAPHVMA